MKTYNETTKTGNLFALSLAAIVCLPSAAHSQSVPGLPEPGLILYGQIRNTTAGGTMLTHGTLQWQVQPNDGSAAISITTPVININDQFSYVLRVPFQTKLTGFILTLNNLELKSSSPGYIRVPTVVLPGLFLSATILPPATDSFDFSVADRGRIERVDLQVAVPVTDTDGDGMDDNWETRYFGSLSRNGLGDRDGDGMSDFAEYKAGTDPNDPQSRFAFIQINANPPNGITVKWSSVATLRYRVERSSTLETGYLPIQTNIPATPGTNTFHDATATGDGPYFYRLRVE